MPTPDYLEQVVISGRARREVGTRSAVGVRGVESKPSISAMVWALLDVVTAVLAGLIALRLRLSADPHAEVQPGLLWNLVHAAHMPSLAHLWRLCRAHVTHLRSLPSR